MPGGLADGGRPALRRPGGQRSGRRSGASGARSAGAVPASGHRRPLAVARARQPAPRSCSSAWRALRGSSEARHRLTTWSVERTWGNWRPSPPPRDEGLFADVNEVIFERRREHLLRPRRRRPGAATSGPHEGVLRSGCYVTHDHSSYGGPPPHGEPGYSGLIPALELWSEILSTPEPGRAIAASAAGRAFRLRPTVVLLASRLASRDVPFPSSPPLRG